MVEGEKDYTIKVERVAADNYHDKLGLGVILTVCDDELTNMTFLWEATLNTGEYQHPKILYDIQD